MDKDALVENLRKMSDKIIEDHEQVSLIMLWGNNVTPEEEPSSFDYIISASWLNGLSQDEGMDLILDYLYDNLSVDVLKRVSRVTIIHTNDPIVKNVSMGIVSSGGDTTIINCRFGNLIIPYAILFES